jgi:hypothetical protein
MPEHQAAAGAFLDAEQVEVLADAAVVALLRLLEPGQVGLEGLGVRPGGAVDALQLLVAGVAAPVGPGDLGELESLQEARAGHVRAAAEVLEVALAVEADVLAGRNFLDDARLVFLADAAEKRHGLVARHHLAVHRLVGLGQFRHALLDGGEIFRREGALEGKVVVKAILDDRADGDLGAGKQLLHGLREQVRSRMANDLEAVLVPSGNDGDRGIFVDLVGGIHEAAAHAAGHRGLGKTGADIGSEFGDRHGAVEAALTAIRKRNDWHESVAAQKRTPRTVRNPANGPKRGVAISDLVGAGGFEPPTPTMST